MKGHIRKRGSSWSYIVDLGLQPCQRCTSCGRRFWLERRALKTCPKCGGELQDSLERRQQEKGGFRTRKEAEAALAARVSEINRGSLVLPGRMTVGEYLETWLQAIRADVKPTTFLSYQGHVRKHIIPALGHVLLSALRPEQIKTFYAGLQSELSPTTIVRIRSTLRRALNDAVRWERITRNPAFDARPPRPRKPEIRAWTAEELKRFLEHEKRSWLYPLWLFLAVTGARRGEALALRWEDLDLENAQATIRRSRVVVGKDVEVSSTKAGRGRTVVLDQETVAVLAAYRKAQLEMKLALGSAYADTGYVFVRPDGAPYHPHSITVAFERAVARTEVPRIRLHDLRHTSATLALQSGVHPKVVQERLGHSSINLTLDIYSHVIPALQAEAAEKIASLIR